MFAVQPKIVHVANPDGRIRRLHPRDWLYVTGPGLVLGLGLATGFINKHLALVALSYGYD